MALLTQSGRTALAVSLKSQPLHVAWGTGSPAWESIFTQAYTIEGERIQPPHASIKQRSLAEASDGFDVDTQVDIITRTNSALPDQVTITYTTGTPPEALQASTLLHEVGRKAVDEITFCVGNENGLLVTPTGRFTASETPTNQLYVQATFDFEDAANETIRELGIFMGTEVADSCPPGQRYFVPSDLKNPGILLVLENTVPLIRTAATREAFSFVITL